MITGQERLAVQLVQVAFKPLGFGSQVRLVFLVLSQLEQFRQSGQVVIQAAVAIDDAAQPGAFLADAAGVLGVGPQVRIVQDRFKFTQSRVFASDVKDTPGG